MQTVVQNELKYTARTKCLVHFFWGIKVMIVDNSSSPPTATTPRKQSNTLKLGVHDMQQALHKAVFGYHKHAVNDM